MLNALIINLSNFKHFESIVYLYVIRTLMRETNEVKSTRYSVWLLADLQRALCSQLPFSSKDFFPVRSQASLAGVLITILYGFS